MCVFTIGCLTVAGSWVLIPFWLFLGGSTGLIRHIDQSEGGADTFIPILILVVLRAQPKTLISNLQFVFLSLYFLFCYTNVYLRYLTPDIFRGFGILTRCRAKTVTTCQVWSVFLHSARRKMENQEITEARNDFRG